MKRKFILIIGLLVFSTIVVFVLFITTKGLNGGRSTFNRVFMSHPFVGSKKFDIKDKSYIAGATSDKVYLGNFSDPYHILICDNTLKDTQRVEIKLKKKILLRVPYVTIDSPYFFVRDMNAYTMLKGNLNNLTLTDTLNDTTFIVDAVPIIHSLILRTWSRNRKEFVLAKKSKSTIERFPSLLEKQIDGKFCTDGMLHFNRDSNMIVYVYYYRNQFICMDTSLNLLYRATTIDTVSHTQIKIAEIKSEKSITLSTPPKIVNNKSQTSGSLLFIHSLTMARNENSEMFDKASVIDLYHLDQGTYKFSFYIPEYDGLKMKDFKIRKNQMIVLYDNHLVLYQFDTRFNDP